jgi:ketosteroid isomerase-like protein
MRNRGVYLTAVLAITLSSHVARVSGQQSSTLERNKVLAQRYHLDIIEKQNLKLADEIIAPDCVFHMPSSRPTDKRGPERAKEVALNDLKTNPKGFSFAHDTIMAEGDLVAFRWTFTGIRESGEKAVYEGIDIVRIENGKVAEVWSKYHRVGGPQR